MSDHHAPAIKPADDPAFQLPAALNNLSIPLATGGLALLIVGWAIGFFGVSAKVGMSAYLTAFMYGLTLAIGCLFFVIIQHLVRAGWSVVVRRIAELVMIMIVPLAILFLPILATLISGNGTLYVWDDPNYAAELGVADDVWAEKTRWLNQTWFSVRAVIYFGIWTALALFFYRGSSEQDSTGERKATERMQYWSGPAAMVFSLTTTLAAFDWVMSLAPMWFSTMFGVYLFTGSMLAAHCLIAAASFGLQKLGAMRDEVTTEHYHDLAKLIFGFTLFWIYIAFSQYLLIWYGNIPEETEWFYHRQKGGWEFLSIALIVFHWIVPFLGTMSLFVRRRPALIAFWAVYILVMHFLDVFWMIMPEAYVDAPPASLGFLGIVSALLCLLGVLALMGGLVLRTAGSTRIVPVRDPRLGESLAFENI